MPPERSSCFRVVNVEPILFFISFASILSDAPFQDLMLQRICREMPEIPADACESLPQHPNEEELVQPKAAVLLMAKALLEAILPAVVAFWIGPWSDRTKRRKPLLIFPLAGYALRFAILAILVGFPSLPADYFLLSSIPVALTGGLVAMFTSLTCIVGDETEGDGRLRTLRLGLLQASFIIGFLPGSLSSAPLLNAFGYHGVFIISGFVCFFALILALVLVKDNPSTPSISDTGLKHHLGLVKETFQTALKERPNGQRTCVLLCILALATSIIPFEGESNLGFMYARQKFGWEVKDFTVFISVNISLIMFGTVFGVVVLSNKLKIPDAPLTASVYLSKVISCGVRAFATEPWMMYCSSVIAIFSDISSPVSRSIMSKNVPQEELGKVFSLTASLEALTPLASSPLYTLLYNKTLHSFPGGFYLLSAGIYFIDFFLLSIVGLTQLKYSRVPTEPLNDTEEEST